MGGLSNEKGKNLLLLYLWHFVWCFALQAVALTMMKEI